MSAGQGRRPDTFYVDVAAMAAEWVAEYGSMHRFAVELAECNDVPVTTVHRWIKEARRRGLWSTVRSNVCPVCGAPPSGQRSRTW